MEINFNKVSNCAQETEETHAYLVRVTDAEERSVRAHQPVRVINKHLRGHSSARRLTKPHNDGGKGHVVLIDVCEMLIYSFLMDLNVQVFSVHRN